MSIIMKVKLFLSLIILIWLSTVTVFAEDPIAVIHIPSIEVRSEVIPLHTRKFSYGATWDTRRLNDNVGYLTGTGWFGNNQNVVLGGHSETYQRQPSIFYHLADVQVGDVIHVEANDTTYNYIVTSLEWVDPTNLNSVLPTGHAQLTLITCDTNSYDGSRYQQRLVIRALPG